MQSTMVVRLDQHQLRILSGTWMKVTAYIAHTFKVLGAYGRARINVHINKGSLQLALIALCLVGLEHQPAVVTAVATGATTPPIHSDLIGLPHPEHHALWGSLQLALLLMRILYILFLQE